MNDYNTENHGPDFDIFTACSLGDITEVEYLILTSKNRNIVSKKNSEGWTPLMYACYHGHKSVIECLVTNAADKSVLNKSRQSAFMLAVQHDDTKILSLVYKEELINIFDKSKMSPLCYAVVYGCYKSAKWLLQNNANPDFIEHKSGNSLIMIAVQNHTYNIVTLLLKYGVDLGVTNKNKETALTLAIKQGQYSIAILLEAHKGGNNLEKVLENLSLKKYWPVMESNGIDLSKFLTMKEDDLIKIGIVLLGPRKKMVLLIDKMNDQLMESLKACSY